MRSNVLPTGVNIVGIGDVSLFPLRGFTVDTLTGIIMRWGGIERYTCCKIDVFVGSRRVRQGRSTNVSYASMLLYSIPVKACGFGKH